MTDDMTKAKGIKAQRMTLRFQIAETQVDGDAVNNYDGKSWKSLDSYGLCIYFIF